MPPPGENPDIPSTTWQPLVIETPASPSFYTNTSQVLITGRCHPGAFITIRGASQADITCTAGTLNYLAEQQQDGEYNYILTQTDEIGTPKGEILSLLWNKDTVAPDALNITFPPNQSYTSAESHLTVVGTCEMGATVILTNPIQATWPCDPTLNTFTYTFTPGNDGTHTLIFSQQDRAGNLSAHQELIWQRNTQIPNDPIVLVPDQADVYSNGSLMTISGTCETLALVKMEVFASTTQTRVDEQQIPCSPQGTFALDVQTTVDDRYDITLWQTNNAGSDSNTTGLHWHRDTQTPEQVVILAPATSPSFSSGSQIEISGSCEIGSTVELSGDSTTTTLCTPQSTFMFLIKKTNDGQYTFVLTQVDRAGNRSATFQHIWQRDTTAPNAVQIVLPGASPYTSADDIILIQGNCEPDCLVQLTGDATDSIQCSMLGEFQMSIEKLTDGQYAYQISQIDQAGNISAESPWVWVRNTVIPDTPILIAPATQNYVSHESTLTLEVGCDESINAKVVIAGDVVASDMVIPSNSLEQICSNGQVTFQLNQNTDEIYTYTITQQHPLNLLESGELTIEWQRDTLAPDPIVLTVPVVQSFTLSSNSEIELSGNCTIGHTIELSGDETATTSCTSQATFSFVVEKTNDGTYQFLLTQIDSANNRSTAVQHTWQRDTTAPDTIQLSLPGASPYTSADSLIVLQGACEPDSLVELTGATTDSVQCPVLGIFQFSVEQLTDGQYSYTLRQTDLAGNTSDESIWTWIRNTVIPDTPTLITPATQMYTSNESILTMDVACDDTITAKVLIAGDVVLNDMIIPQNSLEQTCSNGQVTFRLNQTTDGFYTYTITQQHPLTLLESGALTIEWQRDTVEPNPIGLTEPMVQPFTSPGILTLSGACESLSTIEVTGDGQQSVLCVGGVFSLTLDPGTDGSYLYHVAQIDPAGNRSSETDVNWTRDSSSATPVTILQPATSIVTSNAASLLIQGACNTGYTVHLSGDVLASEVSQPVAQLTQVCLANQFSFQIDKTSENTFSLQTYQSYGGVDSSPRTITWHRDTTAPQSTITTSPPTTNVSLVARFTFSSDDNLATLHCKLDSGNFATCSSPITYTSLSNGSHTLTVRALDTAGNLGPEVSSTWNQAAYQTVGLYHLNATLPTEDSSNYTLLGGFANGLVATGAPGVNTTGRYPTGTPRSRNMGTNIFYSVPSNATWSTMNTTMTLEGFFRITAQPTVNNNYYTLLSRTGGANNLGWEVRLSRVGGSGNSRLVFLGSTDGVTYQINQQSNNITASNNTWYYFAVTWNGGENQFYFGTTAATAVGTQGTVGTTALFDTTASLRLGANTTSGTMPSQWMVGALDEIRLSQVVRTITFPTGEWSAD